MYKNQQSQSLYVSYIIYKYIYVRLDKEILFFRWRLITGRKVLVEKLVYLTLILGNCEDNSPCQISGSSTASPLVLQNCWKGWSCFLSLILSPIGAAETDCSSAASSTNLNWNLVEQIGDQRELLGEYDNLRLALAALIAHLSFVQHDPAGQGGT